MLKIFGLLCTAKMSNLPCLVLNCGWTTYPQAPGAGVEVGDCVAALTSCQLASRPWQTAGSTRKTSAWLFVVCWLFDSGEVHEHKSYYRWWSGGTAGITDHKWRWGLVCWSRRSGVRLQRREKVRQTSASPRRHETPGWPRDSWEINKMELEWLPFVWSLGSDGER